MMVLSNGSGQRVGYDVATGQVVNQIPGAQIGGDGSITVPGRLGGYTTTLYATTPQQVELQFGPVGGQTKTYQVNVTPQLPTAVATTLVVENGAPLTEAAPAPAACAPRPRVAISPAAGGGALQVVITAGTAPGTTVNGIREIRVGQAVRNGLVDVQGVPGATNLGAGGRAVLPTPAQQVVLRVHRAVPGQSTTVPLIVVDSCGEWSTFVGGGLGAGF